MTRSASRALKKQAVRAAAKTNGTRTLIVSTCYADNPFKIANMDLWLRAIDALSPGIDICLINSCSPINPMELLGERGFIEALSYADDLPIYPQPRLMISIAENIGRLETTGQDGPQQAWALGMNFAIKNGYDYIAHIEADLVFAAPIAPIIQRMKRQNIMAACPFSYEYSFIETGALFMNTEWFRRRDYFKAYDWRKPPVIKSITQMRGGQVAMQREFHERWMEQWCGEDLVILPLRGTRNDNDRVTVNNFQFAFPHGCDFLTHCKDLELYRVMMRMNGIET